MFSSISFLFLPCGSCWPLCVNRSTPDSTEVWATTAESLLECEYVSFGLTDVVADCNLLMGDASTGRFASDTVVEDSSSKALERNG